MKGARRMNLMTNRPKAFLLSGLVLVSVFFSAGWAYQIDIRDARSFYTAVKIKGAEEVFIAGFSDLRPRKLTVGKIGSLRFVSNIPVRRALGDRVASRLATKGFNVKNVSFTLKPARISSVLAENNVERLVTGDIYSLSLSGIDPDMKKVTGKSVFNVIVYDTTGEIILEKYFFIKVDGDITDTPLSGAEKLMEKLLSASVDSVFADEDFRSVMGVKASPEDEGVPPYYDEKTSGEMNTFLYQYISGKIDGREFERSREELINSF